MRIAGLDYIRFFAACCVLFFHTGFLSWAATQGINYHLEGSPTYPELEFLNVGWIGVQIFFVLSGLVIAQSAEGSTAYRFFRGRVGRLLPAVLICATISLVLILTFSLEPAWTAITNYVRTLVFHPKGPWISGVYWTLTLEVTFYAMIFALLLVNRFRWIEPFAWLLGAFSTANIVAQAFFGMHGISQHTLAQHGCYFAIGIFLWLIVAKGYGAFRLASIALFSVAGLVELNYLAHGILGGVDSATASLVWLAALLAIWFVFAKAVPGGEFSKTLGKMTYPLYLVHVALGALVLRINPSTGKYLALIISVFACLVVSYIVCLLEPGLRRLLERTIDRLTIRIATMPLVNRTRAIQTGVPDA